MSATEVEKLEQQFSEWLGVQGAVATGYGRGALWLALEMAIDGRPGAEVLVPGFVCEQVPEAVRRAGGRPVFFPVREDLTVEERGFEAAITRHARAAVLVHYYGCVLPNIQQLAEICRRNSVLLIEDCALALGARWNGRRAGRFGDLAAFSFTKSDWCYGGGMLATPVRDWTARLRKLSAEKCRSAARLARCYGLLRRLDFAANQPGKARMAGLAGRWVEKGISLVEPSVAGNFFDAGRFDAMMPEFAARRAGKILCGLESAIARRRADRAVLWSRLQADLAADTAQSPRIGERSPLALLRRTTHTGDTGSFLLLDACDGGAREWMRRAESCGWTLRLSWPAYQSVEATLSGSLARLAGRLLVAEVR